MKRKIQIKCWVALLLAALLLVNAGSALAQSYYFRVDELTADVYINEDGGVSLQYDMLFTNAPGAHEIDFVDVGMPTGDFSMSGIEAEVSGAPVEVSSSDYQGSGSGFAVVLGSRAIGPGESGRVRVLVPRIDPWLRVDSKDPNYASLVFSPFWFGSEYVEGETLLTVTFHMPPGVKTEEPRWHSAPSGFPSEPATALDDQGRVTYTWSSASVRADREHEFGASFPKQYVPAGAVVDPTLSESLGIDPGAFTGCLCFGGVGAFFILIIAAASRSASRRKLQYLPPKIAIEGMGIKRGLTAVEAAILMEQPLDKVLTMVLFGLVKKGAAQVTKQDPLSVEAITPAPADLLDYENDFLAAFKRPLKEQRAALQATITDLVKSMANKMKGFSRQETVAYYKDIMERAWTQVENAQTPEIRMSTYDKYMEWTMLDRDYDDRTRRVFTGPVFVPTWWSRYDPTFRPASSSGGAPTASSSGAPGGGSPGGGGLSLPNLPGAAFAASMVRGVQNFSSGVIGNVNEFTSAITNKTNPPPPPSRSSSSGRSGGGCACACACAGCACACAGGGR
jgi:hypothetical protein